MADARDVVIIGGGAAGLAAGLYAARWRLNTVLVERMVPGGQIINADIIENYPGLHEGITGVDLSTALEQHASGQGMESAFGEVTSIDVSGSPIVVKTDFEEHQTRSVIIAVGSDHKHLGVPGEAEREGRGVSFCATCDGPFYIDKDIVVVGGGDGALDEGLYLTKMASKVTVVHHEDQLQAQTVYQERAQENPKMEFVWDSVVDSIGGADGVESVSIRNLKTGDRSDIAVSGIFPYIGRMPNTKPFEGTVPMDETGHIMVDLRMATEVPGVFAAGECRWQSAGQLANHVGDGVTAAFSAYQYVQSIR
jgi:thioredoxin reductase (NADPH)